jgi:hypothetical protein
MTDDQTTPYLDGHCQSLGRPDQFHALCRRRFRSQFGTEFRCSCPNHDDKEGD